jgi:hypothetical protein
MNQNLVAYLAKFEIPTNSVVQAVQGAGELEADDARLFNALFDIQSDDPVLAARYIANAVMKGAENEAAVRTYVETRIKVAASAAIKSTTFVETPTIVEVNPEVEVTPTPEVEAVAVEVEAAEPIQNAENGVIVAKRGRGRPALAETAYDRAVKAVQASGKYDTKSMIATLEAVGIKKASANVYICKARAAGVIPRI